MSINLENSNHIEMVLLSSPSILEDTNSIEINDLLSDFQDHLYKLQLQENKKECKKQWYRANKDKPEYKEMMKQYAKQYYRDNYSNKAMGKERKNKKRNLSIEEQETKKKELKDYKKTWYLQRKIEMIEQMIKPEKEVQNDIKIAI
jgi:hypothetical protein